MDDLEERLRSLAEPVLARHHADLVELKVLRGRTQIIRVVADREEGIDVDTCALVSNELSRMLDVEDPIKGRYSLEVMSPGLDRPLKTAADFKRNIGRTVRIVKATGQHEGEVTEVSEDTVTLEGGTEPVTVPLADVVKATIVLPW